MSDKSLIGLVYNPRVPEAAGLVHSLVKSLRLQDRAWVASATDLEISDETLADTSVIITAGGDGTILRVVREAAPHSVPILGINLGRVGFMTELSLGEAESKIPAYLSGNPRVEERMMLQASVTLRSDDKPRAVFHALNDVVVSRGAVPRLMDIEVTVNGVPLTAYRADGMIAATATGSTGYALSAGGPVLYPEARMVLIQPVAAHMVLHSGLIVPDNSVIALAVGADDEAVLSVDGLAETAIGPDDAVVVACSPYVARFLRIDPPTAFYANLARRLSSGGHPGSSLPSS